MDDRLSVEDGLKRDIEAAFPASPFHGEVTPADGSEWREELDDDLDLEQNLKGRLWTAVPSEFIDRHHGNLPLLTPLAFASFLPAWLVRALEPSDRGRLVREFIIYCFSPDESERRFPCLAACREDRLSQLTVRQVEVVRRFLALAGDREGSQFVRDHALKALDAIGRSTGRCPGHG